MSGGYDINRAHDQQVGEEGGYQEDLPFTLGDWRTLAGLTLTGSTTPDLATNTFGGEAIKWDHGDTINAVTHGIALQFKMPAQYDAASCDIFLSFNARKIDATADENTTLALAASCAWQTPSRLSDPTPSSTVVPTLRDTPSGGILTSDPIALLAAADTSAATTNRTGWGAYEINIGKAIRAFSATNRPKPGDDIRIVLYPVDAVAGSTLGSTDMDLQVGAPVVRYRRNAGIDWDRRNKS